MVEALPLAGDSPGVSLGGARRTYLWGLGEEMPSESSPAGPPDGSLQWWTGNEIPFEQIQRLAAPVSALQEYTVAVFFDDATGVFTVTYHCDE